MVSLFVLVASEDRPDLRMTDGPAVPSAVRHYRLEDEGDVLRGLCLHEFDAMFDEVPAGLEAALLWLLAEALKGGGFVAWLGFEGSFDFGHLLTDDIATEVYGVGDQSGVDVALSAEQLRSQHWLRRVGAARLSLEKAVDLYRQLPRERPEH